MATPTLPLTTTQMTQLMLTASQQQQLPALFDDSDDEELMGVRERRVGELYAERRKRHRKSFCLLLP